MEIKKLRGRAGELMKKYRYVLIVLLIGVGLMLIPEKKNKESPTVVPSTVEFPDKTEELTQLLSQIQGAGKVRLLLTLDSGVETVYQMDKDLDAGGGVRYQTVTVTDSERNQQGIVQQILAPKYRGAVVLCQGAEDAKVRLAIVDAVSDATGLTTDRISVLKMK